MCVLVLALSLVCHCHCAYLERHMTDILIIGGGVFGLSTALALAKGQYKSNPDRILVIGTSARMVVGRAVFEVQGTFV